MVIIDPQNYFYVCNGDVLKDLRELLNELNSMDDAAFKYHVNSEKNDFYNWVKDVLKDNPLANKIRNSKKRNLMASIVNQRLKDIEKVSNKRDKKTTISQIKEAIGYG
jgi:hypothetical protein